MQKHSKSVSFHSSVELKPNFETSELLQNGVVLQSAQRAALYLKSLQNNWISVPGLGPYLVTVCFWEFLRH